MSMLFLKLLRDIRGSLGQYIAITLVVTLGVAFFVGLTSASTSVRNDIDAFYNAQRLADLWVTVPAADEDVVEQVAALDGVVAAEGRVAFVAEDGDREFVGHTLSADPTVNVPYLESGALPTGSSECIIDLGYAKANELEVGSLLKVQIAEQDYEFWVSGIFNSPEYLYLAKNISEAPNHAIYGALFVSESLLSNTPFNEIVVRTAPDADLSALKQDIQDIAFPTGAGFILERDQNLSWFMLNDDIEQYGRIGAVFPNIFFLVAAAIIFISMSKNVETQRGQIGNMKALGIRRGTIALHFVSYTILTCLVGCILGALLGVFALIPGIQQIFLSFYTMPPLHLSGFAGNIAIASMLAFAFGVLATLVSVRGPLAETPAAAMRPKAPRKVRPTFFERNQRFWAWLSFGSKIVLRNLFMNKGRALLSSLGIIGCVGLMVAAFSFTDCFTYILDDKFDEMNRYDLEVVMKLPGAPLPEVDLSTAAIEDAWPQASVPASFEAAGHTVSTDLIALDADCTAIDLYAADGSRLSFPQHGVLLPQLYADRFGLAVGDRITLTLTPLGGTTRSVEVEIAGLALEYLGQDLYTSFDYVDELGEDLKPSVYYLNLREEDTSPDTLTAVYRDDLSVKLALTKADIANTWAQSMDILNAMVSILIVASAVLALTVVYNISAINIFERRRDIATLKVLGYRRGEVNRLVFSENLFITGFGSVLGIAAGAGMLWLIIRFVASDEMMVPLVMHPLSVVYALVLGFAFTLLANQLLRGKIRRIDMVESLKSVE